MNEEWRPVVGYEGMYEVSDQGNLRTIERTIMTKQGIKKLKARPKKISKRGGYGCTGLGDNIRRAICGEKNCNSKLSYEKVDIIKEYLYNGCTYKEIAELFGISKSTISKIKAGRIWNKYQGE